MQADSAAPGARRAYRYYDLVMAAFVCVLLCANLIGVSKVAQLGGYAFGAGNLFFPLSYLFGDLLTEVYGYRRSRRVVWAGFTALAFASLMSLVIVNLPAADGWSGQVALEAVFGSTWRTALASLLGYACGEFSNSFTLAKLKVRTQGRFLWLRTIGSTVVGEAADTLVFYPLAFLGVWDSSLLLQVMVANYLIKVSWEVFATPVTYQLVAFLKRAENEDYYDVHTKFSPFSLEA
jgi:uncharacterized integral membrane protein (TIGR00697 family)